MILADSNVLIYAAKGTHPGFAAFVAEVQPRFSAITYVEALGYRALPSGEERYLEEVFRVTGLVPVDDAVLREAVRLRQIRKMTLGDALIAGTALAHGWKLATRNKADFSWIAGLEVVDPLSLN